MKELKKEEGQWRWKRHKQSRQLDVEKEKVQAQKIDVQLQVKNMKRKQEALTKGGRSLARREAALGTATEQVIADKQVEPPCSLLFYSLAFSVLIPHLSLCGYLRHLN
jgi:hypothetical protein